MRLVELSAFEDEPVLVDGRYRLQAKAFAGPVAVGDRLTVGSTADGALVDLDVVVEEIVRTDRPITRLPMAHSARLRLAAASPLPTGLTHLAGLIPEPDDRPDVVPLSVASAAWRFRMAVDPQLVDRKRGGLQVKGACAGRLGRDDDLLVVSRGRGESFVVPHRVLAHSTAPVTGGWAVLLLDTDLAGIDLAGDVIGIRYEGSPGTTHR